ncbi:MAG: carbamoyl-phosphate synthase, small subunit [Bacteroidetes bacterium]|jgi:carbamoyl-phosphate synthase small subunit|nr:carbamoyl-phosphate synthase, small subunit [Bacteroidota bacterium]
MQLKYKTKPKAILLLEDGKVFEGKAAGKIGTTTGEICFNTGMTGYQEIFTDPSYYGQIVVMNNVHVGNYGIEASEIESDSIKISGMICKKFNDGFSRKRAQQSLEDYFLNDGVVAISDVDTRAIVRYIRDKGAMNCIISSENMDIDSLKAQLAKVPKMEGLELSSKVSTTKTYEFGDSTSSYKVAVLDYGVKKNILRCLTERGCFLKVFPMKTSKEDILAFNPDGIMLANGPGDPGVMKDEIAIVKSLVETGIPIFGICLGHQLLAESQGISTYKLHAGHRGINHPVKNIITGKCEITSQNHGFTINVDDIAKNPEIEITHVNLNDETIEGIRIKNKPVFSVQYHPESCPGPLDSRYLFDDFVTNIKTVKNKKPAIA